VSDRVFEYIEQLEFTPGSPAWRGLSEAERVLAAFAHFMHDHACDGLCNVIGSGDEALYAAALDAIGAGWAGGEIRRLAHAGVGSASADRAVEALWEQVEERHAELWDAAAFYANLHLPARPWED
jgi:hypothetical protein